MIELTNLPPGTKVIELGGGANRHPLAQVNVDARQCFTPDGRPTVDIPDVDFNKPLPLMDAEWDVVICQYALEHLSFRNVLPFLKEVWRILKPGGVAAFTTANTLAQHDWLRRNPEGWDGKGRFEAASEMFFGSQDYPENTHKLYMDPDIAEALFTAVGFVSVATHAVGERDTDLGVIARKAKEALVLVQGGESVPQSLAEPLRQWKADQDEKGDYSVSVAEKAREMKAAADHHTIAKQWGAIEEEYAKAMGGKSDDCPKCGKSTNPRHVECECDPLVETKFEPAAIEQAIAEASKTPAMPREEMFDKEYFNGGKRVGGYANDAWGSYRDFPCHAITAAHVLARRPESVLEIGCARGYVLKRVQDAGIYGVGLEISRHCHMTRVCDNVILQDIDRKSVV